MQQQPCVAGIRERGSVATAGKAQGQAALAGVQGAGSKGVQHLRVAWQPGGVGLRVRRQRVTAAKHSNTIESVVESAGFSVAVTRCHKGS